LIEGYEKNQTIPLLDDKAFCLQICDQKSVFSGGGGLRVLLIPVLVSFATNSKIYTIVTPPPKKKEKLPVGLLSYFKGT
jgi:hypothetical protein